MQETTLNDLIEQMVAEDDAARIAEQATGEPAMGEERQWGEKAVNEPVYDEPAYPTQSPEEARRYAIQYLAREFAKASMTHHGLPASNMVGLSACAYYAAAQHVRFEEAMSSGEFDELLKHPPETCDEFEAAMNEIMTRSILAFAEAGIPKPDPEDDEMVRSYDRMIRGLSEFGITIRRS